jgi:hypothetical protein
MNPRSPRAQIVLISSALLVACGPVVESGSADTAAAVSASNRQVHLPAALGGGVGSTSLAPSTPGKKHGYGAKPEAAAPESEGAEQPAAAPPATVDISADAPPAGDQMSTDSCTTWATAHSALGWWANHRGYNGATFAPMYLYAQLAAGNCTTTTAISTVLGMIQSQGVDTQTDYEPMQYDLDCGTEPTSAKRANAARFKISGYQIHSLSGGVEQAIKSVLASGQPAILGIQVYPEFDGANASSYLVGPPKAGDGLSGGHAITAFAYDENGVWILNSWSTSWGRNGWAELSWDFVNGSFGGTRNVGTVASIDDVAFACNDSNASCAAWAFTAQCQANPAYMLANCCRSCADPNPTFTTSVEWFRIQNLALGSSFSLDTGVIAATGNYSGQYWSLTPLGGGAYRLTNLFQGDATSFDTTQMAASGNYSGQYWTLTAVTNGVYRLTNAFLGTGASLAVDPSTHTIVSATTAESTTQYWQIAQIP